MRRRALLLALAAVGCGARSRPAPPSAPRVNRAADLIPADLDVVVRLDLGRIKATLGAAVLGELAKRVAAEDRADAPDRLVLGTLLEADVVYLGYRPDESWLPLDRVLVVQGRFATPMKTPTGFTGATDWGADLRSWDSKVPPSARGGVARVYALGERVRAFVSEAELDAVERSLAGLPTAEPLAPEEAGTVSLAARPEQLVRLVGSGRLKELLEGASRLGAVAELEADGIHLRAELLLDSAETAERLASAGQLALGNLLGERAEQLDVRADAERVLLTARFGRSELGALFRLPGGGAGQGPSPSAESGN